MGTDQSLDEIDNFSKGGVSVNVGGEQWSIGGKAGSTLQCGNCGTEPDASQKFCQNHGPQGGGFGASGGAGGFGASGGARGGKPGTGNLNFAAGTNAGDAFFNQHKVNEAKK